MQNTARRWYSTLDTVIERGGEPGKLYMVELRDIARGFCGALFLALPLLYTEEMWERARVMPNWDLALFVAFAYLGNVGFALFNGFKSDLKRKAAWFDALTSMGIGLVASSVSLLLIGRYTFGTPTDLVVKLLLLETIPSSFGASLAINQLGARGQKGDGPTMERAYSADFTKIIGTILGALMFSFNIAPTIEPKIITYTISWWHTLAIILFSLFVSYLMVFFAGFITQDDEEGGVLQSRWVETIVAYLVSLIISGLLLWAFGYLTWNTSLNIAIPWLATMGYATTLGGSAGRLVL